MMSARAFLEGQLRRAERANLDVALLTARGAAYATSRMGLIGARALLRTALHVAELIILTRYIPFQFIVPLFAMRAIPGLLSGLHWGALETLRSRVREEARGRRLEAARAEVELWLTVSALAGLLLTGAVTTFIANQPDPEGAPLGLYGAFAIVCACAAATELYTRTYHAGVFALGRVYRPAWTLFLVEPLELGTLFVTYDTLGPFALHLTVLVGSGVRASITLFYARRIYQRRRLGAPHLLRLRALKRLRVRDLLGSARHVLASLPLQLDRMLLIALLRAPPGAMDTLPLAMPFYALRPIAGFAQSWARAFYPDLVRLDSAAWGVLRGRFERLLRRTAIAAGTASILLFGVGAAILFGLNGLYATLWLTPLALVRSRFALTQLQGFAYGQFGSLLRTGTVLLGGLMLARWLRFSDRGMVAFVVVLLGAAQLVAGRLTSRAVLRRAQLARRLPISAWLAQLETQARPTRLRAALVDKRVIHTGAALVTLARNLHAGKVTRVGRAWLLWWEPADEARSRAELARLFAGSIQTFHEASGLSGREALIHAVSSFPLPTDLVSALRAPRPMSPASALTQQVTALMPDVRIVELASTSAALTDMRLRELAAIRRAIVAEALHQDTVPRSATYRVAVYAPRGEAELAFVWPGRTPSGGAVAQAVRLATWRDSLRETLPTREDGDARRTERNTTSGDTRPASGIDPAA